ncbi:hypothetical protein MKX01_003237 [Papaver californicum]|nr:hypothetical protein MKX01_003237 [Papaver californicum]
MPSYTAIALERLLQPNSSSPSPSSKSNFKHQINNNNNSVVTTTKTKKPPKHIYISSPALYTTPEPAPIPYTSTSDSVSPSPYVVNHKRRDHFHVIPEATNRHHGFQVTKSTSSSSGGGGGDNNGETNVEVRNDGIAENSLLEVEIEDGELVVETNVRDQNAADFTTPIKNVVEISNLGDCDYASCASTLATKTLKVLQSQSEFFDADEEFFSDSSISNASPSRSRFSSIEELHAARVHLFDEIERRKRAEDALARMCNHWQSINSHWCASGVGLSLPATQEYEVDTELELDDRVEKFCQEVVVARFVSEAVGRGLARAEIEAAAKTVLESKNLEVLQLRDKLQYYEAVNHEMFQRNQEVVELTRKQRAVRKMKHRWIWSCIGLSITLGASLLAYSYLPSNNSSHSTADFADVLPLPDSASTSASVN